MIFSDSKPVSFRADASEFWELSQSRRLASEFELTRKLNIGRWSWLVEELELSTTIAESVVGNFREFPELWKLWIRSTGHVLVWAEAVQERLQSFKQLAQRHSEVVKTMAGVLSQSQRGGSGVGGVHRDARFLTREEREAPEHDDY